MASDIARLQKAIYEHLAGDAALIALLGGSKIYDRPAESVALPYVTLGTTRAFNAGTASEQAQEHLFTIHAWSRQGGRKQAMALIAAVQARLQTLGNVTDGMRIVSLRVQAEDVTYNEAIAGYQGILRIRAMTEAETL